jgi:hypothetical protein
MRPIKVRLNRFTILSFGCLTALSSICISCSSNEPHEEVLEKLNLAELPVSGTNIFTETLDRDSSKYYFLVFKIDEEDVDRWLKINYHLIPATVETVFERGLVVHPSRVPDKFSSLARQVDGGQEMYFDKNLIGLYFTLIIVDRQNSTILIESRQAWR